MTVEEAIEELEKALKKYSYGEVKVRTNGGLFKILDWDISKNGDLIFEIDA